MDNYSQNWFQMWMDQSKEFYISAEKNLHHIFTKEATSNPEAHMEQIKAWMESLKSQWNTLNTKEEYDPNEKYWKAMTTLSAEAAELMLKEWIRLTKEDKPITNVRELYELWLSCCQQVYAKSIKTPNFQDMYGEFMKAGLKFWKMAE